MMQKVSLFIVGQPKSGTTALAYFLDQHPHITVSIPKETGYFASDLRKESDKFHNKAKFFHIRNSKQYKASFAHALQSDLLCDASTNYLYSKEAAENIYNYNKNAKIVMILRDPIDMIHSLYNQYRIEDKEDIATFELAIKHEKDRKKGKMLNKKYPSPSYLYYTDRAKYYEQVKRFYLLFGSKNIKVIFFEDFKNDNMGTFKDIIKFISINDKDFIPKIKDVNEHKTPRSGLLLKTAHNQFIKSALLKAVGQRRYTSIQNNIAKPIVYKKSPKVKLDPQTNSHLRKILEPDIKSLSKLLNKDLIKYWWSI